MYIALLGGTFDPPHNYHKLIAEQTLRLFPVIDELWFMPNYHQNPPKPASSPEDRLAMTRLLDVPRTRVSTIEIDNKLNGETINILPYLSKEHTYFSIIGSDLLRGFGKWRGRKKLLQAMHFLVFPRPGYPLEPLYKGMDVIPYEPEIVEGSISSSLNRELVRSGEPIDNFVPPEIAQYIDQHSLYR